MSPTRNASLDLRRTPRQARSRDTIDVILEASARILEDSGLAAFNTNAVAERAGIGIASLYDYFPSKDAILIEFARREIARHRSAVMGAVSSAIESGDAEPERTVIRTLMRASDTRTTIRQIAARILTQAGREDELSDSLRQMSAFIADRWPQLPNNDRNNLTSERAFVLTRAISGVLSAIVRENTTIDRQKLEDELVTLAKAMTRTLP